MCLNSITPTAPRCIDVTNLLAAMNAQRRYACYPGSTFYLLSDGLSIQHRRITKSAFRPCSTYRSRSQAPFYLYARCLIANQAEGTFELLRYLLGGDRPSQTAQITLSTARFHGPELEFKHNKAGVSLTTPQTPKRLVNSLPATLRMLGLNPILSYS